MSSTRPAAVVVRVPVLVLLPLVLGLVAAGCTAPRSTDTDGADGREPGDPGGFVGHVVAYTRPEVVLVDTRGAAFDLATGSSRHPVTIFFFGYTSCLDVCDLVLAGLATALRKVTPDVRGQVQVVVVTTDPARDTPAVLADYLARFELPAAVGLTGSIDDVVTAGRALGVEVVDGRPLPGGGYEVGHSAHLVGFGPASTDPVVWTQGTAALDLAHDVERLAGAADRAW